MASRSWMVFKIKRRLKRQAKAREVTWQMFGADHTVGGQEAVLDVSEHRVRPVEGRVAGRGRPDPVTWRWWTIPGCSAMQRNHWPPSLTTVVPVWTSDTGAWSHRPGSHAPPA